MQIKLFATLKDRARASEIAVILPVNEAVRVSELRDLIQQQHVTLADLIPHAVIAVNQEFAFNDDMVESSDEVAVFPPVSGGADFPTYVAITRDPINLDALQRFVTTEFDGSAVLFIGTVRKRTGADEVTVQLDYEAYQSMAESKMRQVADEMRAKFVGAHGIALVQRIGSMQAGEPTIAVVVSSAHRGDGAFEAARYGIDRIKQIVPVWKREVRPDGSSWVEGDYTPQRGD